MVRKPADIDSGGQLVVRRLGAKFNRGRGVERLGAWGDLAGNRSDSGLVASTQVR